MPDAMPDFDALAAIYEQLGVPLTGPFSLDALALADLPPGARILDVAAGTGALALPAARAGLEVHASDLAPAMVARLEAKLAPFPSCTAAVGNCTQLDAPDGGADAAFSIFGVAIIPPWRAGLAAMVQAVRPSGLVVVGAWLEDRGSKPFRVLRDSFATLFPEREFMPENSFPEWSAASLAEALRTAGCTDVAVHPRTHVVVKASRAAATADTMPFATMAAGVRALGPDELSRLEAEIVRGYGAYAEADGTVRLPMEALIAVGRTPA